MDGAPVINGRDMIVTRWLGFSALLLLAVVQVVELTSRWPFLDDTPSPIGRNPVTVDDLASSHADRFGLEITLAEIAPGVTLVADSQVVDLGELQLRGLARVADISFTDLSSLTFPSAADSDPSGEFRALRWSLTVGEGPPELLLAREDDGITRLVDARLMVDMPLVQRLLSTTPVSTPPYQPAISTSRARGPIVDGLLGFVLLLVGGAFLPRTVLRAPVRIPAAFIVGVAALAVVGLLRLSGVLPIIVLLGVAVSSGLAARRQGIPVGWIRRDASPLLAAGLVLGIASWWSRSAGHIATSPDSFRYLLGGRLIATEQFDVGLLEAKHMIGQQGLHSVAISLGVEGFQSLGLLTLLASVALVSTAILSWSPTPRWSTTGAATLGAALLLTSAPVWMMAAYVNAHVMLGALITLVVAGWLLTCSNPERRRYFAVAAGICLAAIVVLRPEGVLIAGLLLAGTIRPREHELAWAPAWVLVGASTVVWQSSLIVGASVRGRETPLLAVALLGLGCAVALIPALARLVEQGVLHGIAVTVLVSAWIFTFTLLSAPADDMRFFTAMGVNLFGGAGGWGTTGIALAALAISGFVLSGLRPAGGPLAVGRFLLIGWLPLALIVKLADGLHDAPIHSEDVLTVFLSGGGRIGWTDSVNRMWMHVLAPASLVTIAALVDRLEPSQAMPRRSRILVERVFAALGIASLCTIAAAWSPLYSDSALVRWAPSFACGLFATALGSRILAVRTTRSGRPSESQPLWLWGQTRFTKTR